MTGLVMMDSVGGTAEVALLPPPPLDMPLPGTFNLSVLVVSNLLNIGTLPFLEVVLPGMLGEM